MLPARLLVLHCASKRGIGIACSDAQAQQLQCFLWWLWFAVLNAPATATVTRSGSETADAYDCANGRGLLCSVGYSAPTGVGNTGTVTTKTTSFDIYSRPAATTTVIDGQSFVSSIAYDNQGRPKHAVYPQATSAASPLALTTSYNPSGYADEVKHATTGQSYWKVSVGGRNDDGQLKLATLGGVLTVNHSYSNTDNLGRIATVNVTSGSNPLLAQTFDFESVGNLKGRSLTGGTGASARTELEIFGYDTLDRLLQSSGTGINDTGSNAIDLAGNLSSKAGLLLGYQSNSNRLCAIGASSCGAGTGNIAYDGNGNIQSYIRPTQAQSNNAPGADGALLQLSGYTAFNLPTSITKSLGGTIKASAEFGYDAGYQRIRQIKRAGATQTGTFVDDILYVVPGGFEVHRNATGQIIKSIATVSGSDGVVATVTTSFDAVTGIPLTQHPTAQNGFDVSSNNSGVNTVTKLILKDHLGSMVAEITLGGTPQAPTVRVNTLSIHGFGPWGNARNGLNGDQRGFTGHEHLAELGIIHMNGRLYDPVLGRFLQADPIIQAPHNAQSHNRYAYVLNNPLSFTDPSGFSFWTKWRKPIIGLVAAIVTAGAATWAMGAYATLYGSTVFATAGVASTSLTGIGTAVAAAAGGFAAGGINGGNIQSALRGAFTAALTVGVLQGIEGLASGAGGAEGGLTVPSPAIDYLRNADGTATSFAEIKWLSDGHLYDVQPWANNVQTSIRLTPTGEEMWDWLAKGPTDRSTVSGAIWMGMMAMPGLSRGTSALRAGQAGRFSQLNNLRVTGDNLTPHHMPQAAANFTSRAEGGALAMTHTEHAATRTFAGKGALTSRLEADMSFRDVLARDINDVRSIVGTRYNEGLKDLLEYYRKNFPELMAKP